jgi:hypothetical protein
VLKIAGAAHDSWTFLGNELPADPEVIDFLYEAEHLNQAVAAAYGDGTREARLPSRRFERIAR